MNLFELFVKIGVDDQASKNIANITQKLGNGLKTAAKIGAAAVGVAATGITALTTAAVKNYAEYEQLVGGVDTLFKDASQKVQKYASEAYRTAGMSANDYMENATAFSASLINALEGDTEAAAEYANRAMVSMSDNANKMGTNIDSIVQTYQSLSRGNFAMLDNLKLGYGGTKAELERLIADAASYTDIQEKMGITVDKSSMSFDNIVNAIAVVQGHLGIAGATALEAATTIEGSVNSMKASWSNLITGIADENADFGGLVDQFVDSAVAVGENLFPRLEIALGGIGDLIDELAPVIIEKVPSLISSILPKVLEGAGSILSAIVGILPEAVSTIGSMLPDLVSTFADLIPDLASAILTAIPLFLEEIAKILPTVIEEVGNIILEVFPLLLEAIISLIGIIAENIGPIIKKLVEIIPKITEGVNNAIKDNAPELIQALISLILEIVKNLPSLIKMLTDQIEPIVTTITQVLVENLPIIIAGIAQIVWELVKAMPTLLSSLNETVLGIFKGIGKGIVNAWPKFKEGMKEVWDKLTNWLGEKLDEAKTWGKDLIDNFVSGIKAKVEKLKNTVSNVAQTVKDFLGFSEPEKGPLSNFHTYAPDMIDLFIKGVKDNEKRLINQISDTFDFEDLIGGDYDMEYAVETESTPYEGDTFTESLANAMNALIAVEENRKVEVEVSINGSDTETGRMLLNLINVTAKEVYA